MSQLRRAFLSGLAATAAMTVLHGWLNLEWFERGGGGERPLKIGFLPVT